MGERTKAIERDARIGLDTGMPARVKEIKEWLAINRGQWEEGLTHSFERLFQMGKEKEVSYLQVCFLRTSLLTGGYFYRACFYDSLYYLDPEPVCINVDTWFVYQFFQEDVEGCIQKLQGRYKRLYPNDIMKIKELCNFYYIGLMKMCVEAILPGLLETKAYTGLKKAENFRILFGEYMGKAEVIDGLFYSDTR